MGYRIKTVSALTGIPKNTLVAWERRYGVLNPKRQANGYRVYSDDDIAKLVQLKTRLEEGLKISEAVELLRDATPENNVAPVIATSDKEAFLSVQEHLREALLSFNRSKADAIVRRMVNIPFEDTIENVYFPILRQIGTLWEAKEVTITQEHFASSFLRDQLVAMLLAIGCGSGSGKHATCVTFPKERHEIAALALSVRLSLAGHRVTYLGADLPVEELCNFVSQHQPALVCVSLIMRVEPSVVLDYAQRIRNALDEASRLVIGGAGLPMMNTQVPGVTMLHDWSTMNMSRGLGVGSVGR